MGHNPIVPKYHADPFAYRHGDDWYLVLTTEAEAWEGSKFHIFHSKDLLQWSEPAEILDAADLGWAKSMVWAPTLIEKDGYWYFVFAAEQQIGVAVCDTPMGRYRDVLGKPLIEKNRYGIQSIDPSLFRDTDGKYYLIWGSGRCYISEISLAPDKVELVGETKCLSDDFYWQRSTGYEHGYDPSIFCEGADLIRFKGRYLLTWSVYDTRDYRYSIRYAWAEKVTGPYVQPLDFDHDNFLIRGRGKILGTGHGNVVEKDGELWSFYHRMAQPGYGLHREVCCDKIEIEPDGLHLKAIPTE